MAFLPHEGLLTSPEKDFTFFIREWDLLHTNTKVFFYKQKTLDICLSDRIWCPPAKEKKSTKKELKPIKTDKESRTRKILPKQQVFDSKSKFLEHRRIPCLWNTANVNMKSAIFCGGCFEWELKMVLWMANPKKASLDILTNMTVVHSYNMKYKKYLSTFLQHISP